MNRKVTSLSAAALAAVIAVTPVSGALAATSAPTAVAATPAAVLKNVGSATGINPANAPAVTPADVAPLVVVTDAARNASAAPAATPAVSSLAAAAPSAAVDATPVSLAELPKSVTDALNVAGLPLAAVWRVYQTGLGVYTVLYKLLTTVPTAILSGKWGTVPTILQTAAGDILTWIATGKAPVVPEKPKAASTDATTAPLMVANPVTDALNFAGLPFQFAWQGYQAGLTTYTTFYKLLTSVPTAFLSGKWGDIPTLITTAVTSSIKAFTDIPGKILGPVATTLAGGADSVAVAPAAERAVSARSLSASLAPAGESELDATAATSGAAAAARGTGIPDSSAAQDKGTPVASGEQNSSDQASTVVEPAESPKQKDQPSKQKDEPAKQADEPAKTADKPVAAESSKPEGSTSSAEGTKPADKTSAPTVEKEQPAATGSAPSGSKGDDASTAKPDSSSTSSTGSTEK